MTSLPVVLMPENVDLREEGVDSWWCSGCGIRGGSRGGKGRARRGRSLRECSRLGGRRRERAGWGQVERGGEGRGWVEEKDGGGGRQGGVAWGGEGRKEW